MTKPKKDPQNISKIKRLQIPTSARNSTISDSLKETKSDSLRNADRRIEIENLRVNLEDLDNLEKFKLPELPRSSKKMKVRENCQKVVNTAKEEKKFYVFQDINSNKENFRTAYSPKSVQSEDSQDGEDLGELSEASNDEPIFGNQKILSKWREHTSVMKKRTKIICDKIKRDPADSITTNNEIRFKNEVAEVIQRLIPQITLTPTIRGFFKLPDRICRKDDYSTWLTLGRREEETDEPLERVGYSRTICDELNFTEDIMRKRTREKNKIYETFKSYKSILEQIEGHYPEFGHLEVKGVQIKPAGPPDPPQNFSFASGHYSTPSPESEEEPNDSENLSLRIAGKTLTYTGAGAMDSSETVLEARVLFECFQGAKTVSHLEMENTGTTAIYYNWELVESRDVLGIPLRNMAVQTFYFDQTDGVLIPGERVNFPFTFKSVKDGTYREKWLLKTVPKLNGGSKIFVVLHGISVQRNIYQQIQDDQMQIEYEKKRDKYIESIVADILKSVKPTPRPPTPVEQTLTVQAKFDNSNQNYYFNDEQFNRLNSLHAASSWEEGEWNYSLDDLYDTILNSPNKIDKQAQLTQFHNCLKKMKKPSKFSARVLRANIMHRYLSSVISSMESTDNTIRANSRYIKTLYVEKSTTKVESQKQGKKKGSLPKPREEQPVKEIHDPHIYFTMQSRQIMQTTTYERLVKALDMVELIYSQI